MIYIHPSPDGDAEVFFDPNLLSDDGTISLSTTYSSEEGAYFVYGLSEAGSDWITVKVGSLVDQGKLMQGRD